MRLADRITSLPPYLFAEVNKRLQALREQGIDVISLGIGSPDLPPPHHIIERLYESALESDAHGYAGYYGIPELRRAVADYYLQRFGVELDPRREVLILLGSKEALFHLSMVFLNPGDVSLIPDPGYPTYSLDALLAGGKPYAMPLLEERAFLPDLQAVPADVLNRSKLLWLNYPNNPTGAAADLEFFERALSFAERHDLVFCHDNPYCDVTFGDYRAPSVLEVPNSREVAVELGSLSKAYNMAGWRVGYAVGNAEAIDALARLKSNVDSGAFRPIQEAAVAVLTGDQTWTTGRNAVYAQRRDVLLPFLQRLGLRACPSVGTLYVWAKLPPGQVAYDYCIDVLEKTGVWLTPGSAFGSHGEGYVRLALTVPEVRLREAGRRLVEALT